MDGRWSPFDSDVRLRLEDHQTGHGGYVMTVVQQESSFRHLALHYASAEQFVQEIEDFLHPGLANGEPALVVVESGKIPLLETRLGEHVNIVSMEEVGRNPGRIISLWQDFLDSHEQTGETVWGVGEPIFPGRSQDELVECQIHERLLNLAFARSHVGFNLACPYDVGSLPIEVIRESEKSHAWLGDSKSPDFHDGNGRFLSGLLSPPSPGATAHRIARDELSALRRLVKERAQAAGVDQKRVVDLQLAVSEIAVNSVLYSGGGEMLLWNAADRFFCEVRDKGTIADPLVGRFRPHSKIERGRGIWLAHQLADLVQIRSGPQGTTIRLTFDCNT